MMPETNILKKDLKELPVSLKLDLYVEVVIATLIEEGKLDAAKLYIRPKGTFSRNYQHDLAKVEVLEDRNTQQTSVYFNINREGMYDMLPEGLFHRNLRKSKFIDTEESVKELKMHEEEEKNARKFFLPLEQMFYHQRIAIEIEEQKSLIGLSEAIVDELISSFWKIPVRLSYYQSLCLAYMLPLMHKIAGNFELTEKCLEILLQAPVKLETARPSWEIVVLEDNKLSTFALGDNLLLGSLLISELNTLQITIGPLENEKVPEFLPNGKQQEYLELLASYFIPAELEYSFKILPKENLPLKLDMAPEYGLLGYSSNI